MKAKKKEKLKAVTGMSEIPFVSEGVAAESAGFVISEEGMENIADALEAGDTATARVAELESQLQTATTAQQTAEASLATANTTIATRDSRIQELEAQVTELENDGTVPATSKKKDPAKKSQVAAHNDPNLAINAMADRLMGGTPAPKEEDDEEENDEE